MLQGHTLVLLQTSAVCVLFKISCYWCCIYMRADKNICTYASQILLSFCNPCVRRGNSAMWVYVYDFVFVYVIFNVPNLVFLWDWSDLLPHIFRTSHLHPDNPVPIIDSEEYEYNRLLVCRWCEWLQLFAYPLEKNWLRDKNVNDNSNGCSNLNLL